MTDRIQLKDHVYMPLQGQWQIVLTGSVIDVPTAGAFSSAHYTKLSEAAGTLVNNTHTPVRNVRIKA